MSLVKLSTVSRLALYRNRIDDVGGRRLTTIRTLIELYIGLKRLIKV
jgi:hypothetical protein